MGKGVGVSGTERARGAWVPRGVGGCAGARAGASVPAFASTGQRVLSRQGAWPGGATAKHANRHFIFSPNCPEPCLFRYKPQQMPRCSASTDCLGKEKLRFAEENVAACGLGTLGSAVRQRREILSWGQGARLHTSHTTARGSGVCPECDLSMPEWRGWKGTLCLKGHRLHSYPRELSSNQPDRADLCIEAFSGLSPAKANEVQTPQQAFYRPAAFRPVLANTVATRGYGVLEMWLV